MSDDKDFEVRIYFVNLPPGQRIVWDCSGIRDMGRIAGAEETELADALALKVASEAEMCANYYVPKG